MIEPTTSATATAAVSVGLAALLAGAVGDVAADVMMVFLAAIAGTVISISGGRSTNLIESIKFLFIATTTSLTLSWAIAAIISGLHPVLASAYTPTIISFLIGTQSMRLGVIASKVTGRIESKIES